MRLEEGKTDEFEKNQKNFPILHGNKHYIVEENGVLCHDNLIKYFAFME